MKINELPTCRKCGRKIAIIEWGIYRKCIVDPAAVMVAADPEGEDFVRIDGSKVCGREVEYEEAVIAEPAYRLHRKTCRMSRQSRKGWAE